MHPLREEPPVDGHLRPRCGFRVGVGFFRLRGLVGVHFGVGSGVEDSGFLVQGFGDRGYWDLNRERHGGGLGLEFMEFVWRGLNTKNNLMS